MVCHAGAPKVSTEPRFTLAGAHLLSLEGKRPTLMGSRCKHCGELYFPAASGCTRCGATELEACELGRDGRLWSWTIQSFCPKPPYNSGETELDFKPYGVGYVEMASGLKVESRLTLADPAQLHIGMPMELTLEPYRRPPQGEPVFTFAFRPALVEPAGPAEETTA
jgi:uncharacterized OB-fold protein